MGLTNSSTGSNLLNTDVELLKSKSDYTIALCGNPNVGKSTIFNALTGMHQHTGNWPGKTVANAYGVCEFEKKSFLFVDLPGTYSLISNSEEEEIAREFICSGNPDVTVIIVDGTCLERNLNLVYQIMEFTSNIIVCVNLLDEAEKKGISIDVPLLSELLGVPVVGTIARKPKTLKKLLDTIKGISNNPPAPIKCTYPKVSNIDDTKDIVIASILKKCEIIASSVISYKQSRYKNTTKKIDKVLTSKVWGIPIMLAFLGIIFWLTIIGANYPSQWLSNLFAFFKDKIIILLNFCNLPQWVIAALMDGVYTTLTWVVSVMLPPMAIFFPIFTLLEDSGFLPRIAFNLDKCFKRACSSGKQALTMCMGFGCNAAGVVGCRIIESPREKLLSILTNNFVPCNGRFPFLITVAMVFIGGFASGFASSLLSTLAVLFVVLLGIVLTLLTSKLLSKTILKGVPSSFVLELPPYRKPQIGKVLVRSLFDRTFFVLGRAVAVAAPAGLVIWLFATIQINEISILTHLATFFDPFGKLMGLDGYIVTAFILGLPANEIVLPIILMSYIKTNTLIELEDINAIGQILVQNGWTLITAINVMIFTLLHFPCSTTLMTIKKETNSWKWTFVSFALPTICGIMVCMFTNLIWTLVV